MRTYPQLLAYPLILFAVSCAKAVPSSNPEDNSASGAAAAAIGGVVNDGSSSGTLSFLKKGSAPRTRFSGVIDVFGMSSAFASTACPTASNGASGCHATGQVMTLTYSQCSFGSSAAIWNGGEQLQASSGTYSSSCGSYIPTGAASTWDLTRTFKGSIGNNPTTRISSSGITTALDTSTGLATYNGAGGIGGGFVTTFSGTTRTQIAIPGVKIQGQSGGTAIFDYVVTTSGGSPLTIDDTGTNKVVNGTLKTYHNLALATGTSTLTGLTFSPGCCTPTSGTITTTFTSASPHFNGKTETMRFAGCGTAEITNVDGSNPTVELPYCF